MKIVTIQLVVQSQVKAKKLLAVVFAVLRIILYEVSCKILLVKVFESEKQRHVLKSLKQQLAVNLKLGRGLKSSTRSKKIITD